MKKFLFCLFITSLVACSFTSNSKGIEPKTGKFEVPAKGEFRMWKDVSHARFSVTLVNPSPNQSCEIYYVKSNGNEKWVNPSLLANSKLTVSIPADGHLFIKNFNPNALTISYEMK
ncbi:MAG: hypothetical protein U5L45_05285 [Saprospiraceae bacterium]|nr:hypothetical protein [Saprospiraceae bacterium]